MFTHPSDSFSKKPRTIEELRQVVVSAKHPISIAGARFSQGGQVAYPDGIVVDMSYLDKIIAFDKKEKRITVQAGATWRSIQEFVDKNGLSVKVMQSYNDFSVGGSLGVNVHARDMRYGSLLGTVEAITVLLADGSLVTADRNTNTDLFYAAIGGYGLLGIIVDATLSLTDNDRLQRRVQRIDADEYPTFFERLKSDPSVIFQNADIFPMKFDQALRITWSKTEKPVTVDEHIQSGFIKYIPRKVLEVLARHLPFLKKTRPFMDTLKSINKMVVWRNYEMSYSTKQLALDSHYPTTMT